MAGMMYKNRSVDMHQFAMIPRADIPRATFRMQKAVKTTFDASYLVPVFCEEVLPGDTFRVGMTSFCRLATPIFPTMDNLHLESFWFFVPNRLVWDNWNRFMGERDPNTNSSIDYLVPESTSPAGGYAINSLQDYFGLPTVGQIGMAATFKHSELPLRMYNLIYNEWFRDQNLINMVPQPTGDSGTLFPELNFTLLRRGKRHDYFTSCLPFVQKGDSVTMPLGTLAPVIPDGLGSPAFKAGSLTPNPFYIRANPGTNTPQWSDGVGNLIAPAGAAASVIQFSNLGTTGLVADLSQATAATINQLRQAFQIQKLLERDARGGTRYTEIIFSHFGVKSPDSRLQRPEYLGGGSVPIVINPIAQTSATEGADTPQGNLAAMGTSLMKSGFTQSFVEHGYVICLVNVRADLSYQQGLRRHWSRRTRYDFYFPVFAMLGEQAVLNKEIYAVGNPTFDDAVFGYQERWAEYRYCPSEIMGLFRSTAAQTIDPWHYSERFLSLPSLNGTFITDRSDLVVERSLAVGDEAGGQQLIGDFFFDIQAARPMPLYSVPGMIDHF